jgi:hypothetical protein
MKLMFVGFVGVDSFESRFFVAHGIVVVVGEIFGGCVECRKSVGGKREK